MSDYVLSIEDVRRFCSAREVDLVMARPPEGFTICLQAEFDGYGDFFRVRCLDVEYIEVAGLITVGDLRLVSSNVLATLAPRWRDVATMYSGAALAIRSASASEWASATPNQTYVIIANTIEFVAGNDWK